MQNKRKLLCMVYKNEINLVIAMRSNNHKYFSTYMLRKPIFNVYGPFHTYITIKVKMKDRG